jgi:hypothetical protein
MHEITSAIKDLCDTVDRFPDTDTQLAEMKVKGIDRAKYEATLPIRGNLQKSRRFLAHFWRRGFRTRVREYAKIFLSA